jgi:hypothetical protein
VQILGDVKSGRSGELKRDLHRWYVNANQIARFLHRANPRHWSLSALRRMMHQHLALTTREAVAELTAHYRVSIRAYDRVEREILAMADMLSTGIIQQFPGRFS